MTQPRIFHLLHSAHTSLFRAADRALRQDLGINSVQQAVLFALSQKDGQPIGDIGKTLHLGKSTLTSLIDRMVALSLVRREAGMDDGRQQLVFIQPAGQKIAAESGVQTRAINTALLKGFSADETATIERFLRHISNNAGQIIEDASAATPHISEKIDD